jgi:hypothetical protein
LGAATVAAADGQPADIRTPKNAAVKSKGGAIARTAKLFSDYLA